MNPLPEPQFLPGGEIVINQPPRGQIVRNHSPRASAAGDIENGIEDLAAAITRRASHFASLGEALTDDIPLSIRNIAGIRSSLWHPKFCTTKYIQCTAFLSCSFSATYAFPIVMQTFFTASKRPSVSRNCPLRFQASKCFILPRHRPHFAQNRRSQTHRTIESRHGRKVEGGVTRLNPYRESVRLADPRGHFLQSSTVNVH